MTRTKQFTLPTFLLRPTFSLRATFSPLARHGLAAAAALAVTLFASAAAACPVCAQRNDGGTLGTVALGAFILMPWCVALVVGWTIRRGLRSSASAVGGTASSEITP